MPITSRCSRNEPALPERKTRPQRVTEIVPTSNHSLGKNFGVVRMSVRQWNLVLISFVTDIKLSVAAEIYFSSLWFISLDYIALLLLIYDSPLPPHLLCKIVKQF